MLLVRIHRHRHVRLGTMTVSYGRFGPGVPWWQRNTWYIWPPRRVQNRWTSQRGDWTFELPLAPGGFVFQVCRWTARNERFP